MSWVIKAERKDELADPVYYVHRSKHNPALAEWSIHLCRAARFSAFEEADVTLGCLSLNTKEWEVFVTPFKNVLEELGKAAG